MLTSESILKIYEAFTLAQGELEGAVKDKTNPHFRNSYADMEAIVAGIKPAFKKNGLGFIQGVQGEGPNSRLVTRIIHKSGEWIETYYPLACKDFTNPQAIASATTYAKRYGLQAATGLPSVDDDGNAAADRPVIQEKQTASAPVVQNHAPTKQEFKAPKEVQARATSGASEYVAKMGKYKGQKFSDLTKQDIQGYASWLKNTAAKEAKPLSGTSKEFVEMAELYLSIKPEHGIDENEELPF